MKAPMKIAAPAADERTPEQIRAAAPVSLPAGSFDHSKLAKDLDRARGSVDGTQAAIQAAMAEGTDFSSSGLSEGYVRMPVVDEETGSLEHRIVYMPPEAAPAETPAKATAEAASKGE